MLTLRDEYETYKEQIDDEEAFFLGAYLFETAIENGIILDSSQVKETVKVFFKDKPEYSAQFKDSFEKGGFALMVVCHKISAGNYRDSTKTALFETIKMELLVWARQYRQSS